MTNASRRSLLAVATLVFAAALPLCGLAEDLAGTYSGQFAGQPARATLTEEGDSVAGTFEVGGYVYRIQGRRQGTGVAGEMIDQEGHAVPLSLESASDRLMMLVEVVPGVPAGTVEVELIRSSAAGSSSVAASSPRAAQAPDGEIDTALVGQWVRRESYTSGDFSAVNERRVTLFPDGTYRFGPGRVIGGGDAGTFDSGEGGESGQAGRWRTKERILYATEPGGTNWEPYARYYVEDNALLLTFGDGSKEIWYRE